MTQEQKKQVQQCVIEFAAKFESQTGAAHNLGVSPAIISQVINGSWASIADAMWRKLSNRACVKQKEWNLAATSVYRKGHEIIMMEKQQPNGIRAIIANASMGKDSLINAFTSKHSRAYTVCCHRQMRMVDLLRAILRAMGKDSSGSVTEMLSSMVYYLERDTEPILLLNEIDKLRDEILELFVDIENKLHNKCGIIFLATPYLKKRIEAGVAKNKRGYAELYSRMRKMFYEITPNKEEFKADVAAICQANGITDAMLIAEFGNRCDNDLRVLYDIVTAYKIKNAA